MVKLPIKTLLDNDRKPFIPYVPMEAIPVDGTGRTLIDLHNALKKTLSEGTASVPLILLKTIDGSPMQLFSIEDQISAAGYGYAISYDSEYLKAPYTSYLIEYLNNAITSGFTQVSFFLTNTAVLAHYRIAEDRTGTKPELISVNLSEEICGKASIKTGIPNALNVNVTYNDDGLITAIEGTGSYYNVPKYSIPYNNRIPYEPEYDYSPAPKKYVDDLLGNVGGGGPILVKELVPTQSATTFSQSNINLGSIDRDNLKALANEVLAEGKRSFILIVAEARSFKHAMVYSVIIRPTETYRLLDMCCLADYDGTVNQLGKATMNSFYIAGSADINKITALDTYVGGGGGAAFYIPTNNKVEYTPTEDYHPATKKYVDDAIAEAIASITGS